MAKKKVAKRKAHKLPTGTQIQIAQKKERNPEMTFHQLAAQFNCTYNQAWRAHKLYKEGKLSGKQGRAKARSVSEIDPTFTTLYERAMKGLSESDLQGAELMRELERAASTMRIHQQVDLSGHIKRKDAHIIARIIRRFYPAASDKEIIEIYYEEMEIAKMEEQA